MKYQTSSRRRSLLIGAVACVGGLARVATAQSSPRIIKVMAERFRYTPDRIDIRQGETVILELLSTDVPMGFNAPAFMVRADILPDAPTRVQINADKPGEFDFFCDVFCGSGHKNMRGKIVVS